MGDELMIPRLHINDRIIHRVYGRAFVVDIYEDNKQASIRVYRERAPRRVLLRDCEKRPGPLPRSMLRLVV